MKKKVKSKRENVWLGFTVLATITTYCAVFYPPASILAIVLMIIAIKGVKYDVL